MKKVMIVSPSRQYIVLMENAGWEIVTELVDADLVLFTGGSDVNPTLYGEKVHPQSMVDEQRDRDDLSVFYAAQIRQMPMSGICRGGQFLNVMNGGRMYQHVTGHALGHTHELVDTRSGQALQVSSTHHQMMIAGSRGEIRGTGGRLATRKEWMDGDKIVCDFDQEDDVEVVLYLGRRTLCFQPHPEFFPAEHECNQYFHELLTEIM